MVCVFFFFQAEDGIRDVAVTGVQTCALPILYGDRISDAGSRCFTVAIAPTVFMTAAEAVPALTRLHALRSGAPSWLAFQLRAELELGDDLSQASIESAVLALLEIGRASCRERV